MIIHIVKSNETLKDIALRYNAIEEDIINNNPQITDFDNLVFGSKIKVPIITKEVEQVLDSTEAFIKEYYPVFSKEEIQNRNKESNSIVDEEKKKIDAIPEKKVVEKRGIPYPGIVPTKY